MAVNVAGGALEWEASLDTTQFDKDVDGLGDKLSGTLKGATNDVNNFSKALIESGKNAGGSLDPKGVQDWSDAIQKASANITALLAKGSSSLDPTKLNAFTEQLAGTDQEFKALSQTITFIKQNLGSLKLNDADTASLAESIKTIENSFDGFNDKAVRVTTQIRALKNEMASMSDKGSPQFIALEKEAANLQREVDESNKSVHLLSSNTAGLQAGVGVLRGVVGGFEAIAGAVGLASGKSDEMQKVITEIISAMGILNGIQSVAEVIDKRSALNQFLLLQYRKFTAEEIVIQAGATEALAGATAAEATATEGATIAQAELNTVMGLNPAFVVLAAVSALAAGIFFLTQKSHEADEAAIKLNKTLLDQYTVSQQIFELSKFAFNQVVATQEANIESARAQNLSQKEILARTIELDKIKNDQAQKDLKKAQDDLTGANSLAKAIGDSFNAYNKLNGIKAKPLDFGFQDTTDVDTLIKKLETLKERITALKDSSHADKNKTLIDNLQSQVDLLTPKIQNYINKLLEVNTTGAKVANDNTSATTKAYDDDVKSFTAAAEAKTLALGKSASEQLQVTLDSIRAQTSAQLDPRLNPNLTQGEITKIKAASLKQQADAVFASNQKEYADTAKLLNSEAQLYKDGTQQRLTLELKAIELSKQAQLQQFIDLNGQAIKFRELSADQQATIVNDINRQVADKQKAFDKQAADDTLEVQISNTKAKLSVVEAGSAEELQLKKDLLDEEAALELTNIHFSISNQDVLAAKIIEINAGIVKAKQDLDDKYVESVLQNDLKLIQLAGDRAKNANNSILSDPSSSPTQRTAAQTSNLNIDADTIRREQQRVETAILEVIRTGNGDMKALIDERHKLSDQLTAINNKIATPPKTDPTLSTIKTLNQVGGALGTIGTNLKQYDSTLGDVFISLGNIAKDAAIIEKLFDKINPASKEEQVAAAIEGAVQLISLLVTAAGQRAQAEAQFTADLLSQQEAYNLSINDSILLNNKLKDNVFTTNFQGELKDGIAALADAQKNFQDSLKALTNGQAKAGQQNAASASAVLQGAGAGAVVGATLGPIGAAVGAVVGGIIGFFGGKKKADVYVNLLQQYPDLLQKGADGVLSINTGLAKSLIANNQLDAATKVLVQDTLDWQDAIDKANQQLTDIISNLAGSLGSDLSNSLVKAFEDGTDAGKAFSDSVGKTLENVLQQLLFNQVFGQAFTDLQQKLKDSFQTGGDFNWQDDLESFFQQYAGLSQTFDDALKSAQTEAAKAGLTIFQSTANNGTNGTNSLAGAIKGITEQQADLLAGQFGGLRITAIDQLKTAQTSLSALNEIVFNTAMLLDVKNTLNYFKLNGIHVV